MTNPLPPTTPVWHPYHGDLVVVAAPGVPGAELKAQRLERSHGPGTWTIPLVVHEAALLSMDSKGRAQISSDDFRWVPWSELKRKDRP